MSYLTAQRNYLESAVQSASPVGQTIMLYDRLVTDLRAACEFMQKDEIEKRCEQMNHALQILAYLENNIDRERGGEAAVSLSRFYAFLRSQFIQAQIKLAPEILEKQIELILQVREAWQQVESKSASAPAGPGKQNSAYGAGSSGAFQTESGEVSASSWTA